MNKTEFENYITNISSDKFEDYRKDLKSFNKISPEQIKELFNNISDDETYLKILKNYLYTSYQMAKSYFDLNNIENMNDFLIAQKENNIYTHFSILNQANKGLIKALQEFEITPEFYLSSHIVWHVRQSILEHKSKVTNRTQNEMTFFGTKDKIGEHYNSENLKLINELEKVETFNDPFLDKRIKHYKENRTA